MEKKRMAQNITIIVLGIAMIIMTVGYAAYSTTLEINGDATMTAAKWDIHFDNIQNKTVPTATGSSGTSSIDTGNLKVSFDTVLSPNEKYEFTVDVVNDGTFNAKLDSITGTGYYVTKDSTNTSWLGTNTPITVAYGTGGVLYTNDYLKYTVTYDDGTALNAGSTGDALTKKGTTGASKKLLVSVEYLQPDDYNKLPSVDTKYHFELDLKYVQD